ncbi:unnamed protein product [Moneuplotes crassus]|uniref:Uncharacterized protein n=1 Tax=Euplotes crassus TaxID=5936 RepID=A0AAD1UTQ1_EUPCR|nr:unnamed protein product [Moneuplotes crassus]
MIKNRESTSRTPHPNVTRPSYFNKRKLTPNHISKFRSNSNRIEKNSKPVVESEKSEQRKNLTTKIQEALFKTNKFMKKYAALYSKSSPKSKFIY